MWNSFQKKFFKPKPLNFLQWRARINEIFKYKNTPKFISFELSALEKNLHDMKSISMLRAMSNEGYTHVLAGTDSEGNLIGQLEFIALNNDEQLKKLHGYQDYIVIDS